MPGQINWFELPAADTAKARTFYGGLFGWSTNAFDGDYHLIDNGPEGAIAPREDGFTHPRVYFATDDVDASVKRVWTTTSPGTQHLRLVSVDRAGPVDAGSSRAGASELIRSRRGARRVAVGRSDHRSWARSPPRTR